MNIYDKNRHCPRYTRWILSVARGLAAILLVVFMPYTLATMTIQMVGNFDASQSTIPKTWEVIRFTERFPPTQYRVIEWDGIDAVEAVAERSMALLARPIDINLKETPMLCWRWRIDQTVMSANMRERSGDDYAARVYVSFSIPEDEIDFNTQFALMVARSRYGQHVPDAAINYVWDNIHPVGTHLPNAYTDRTRMLVVRSGNDDAGLWRLERRDITEDLVTTFGEINATPTQLAIASDTDNTGENARAGFADLHFVSRDTPCQWN